MALPKIKSKKNRAAISMLRIKRYWNREAPEQA